MSNTNIAEAQRQAEQAARFQEVADLAFRALTREHELLAEVERLRAQVASLSHEAWTWSKALEAVTSATLTEEQIDAIAADGMRNAAGGIYATSVYDFAHAITRALGMGKAAAPVQQAEPLTTAPAVARSAPARIWLQISDDATHMHTDFPRHHNDVTWSPTSALACEVEYVRADLAQQANKEPTHD